MFLDNGSIPGFLPYGLQLQDQVERAGDDVSFSLSSDGVIALFGKLHQGETLHVSELTCDYSI